MKKNKSSENNTHFNNNPFRSLKSFKPANETRLPAKTVQQPKEKNEDEAELFMRAVSGVRAINSESNIAKTKKKKDDGVSGCRNRNEEQLFLQAMRTIGAKIRETDEKSEHDVMPRRSPSSRFKQLKRGTITIRSELDLHGCTKDAAVIKLAHFMTAAYGRGHKAVLVITGKGINSPEGPVLQGAVEGWLSGQGKRIVAEFGPAPRDKGGSGAFVVFLKNH